MDGIDSETIDLIYLDPPFNKNKQFTAPIGSSAEGAGFSDIFREEDVKEEWVRTIKEDEPELFAYLSGIRGLGNSYNYCYLCYMAIRLIECRRILKPMGSIYLHCDPTMSHYLKLALDCIFGEKQFANEIAWCYREAINARSGWNKKHDTLLYYGKSLKRVFNADAVLTPHSQTTIKKYRYSDEKGKYRLMGRGIKGSPIKSARDVSPKWEETHPHLVYRQYLREGKYAVDYWMIDVINQSAKERTGYPTQKPLALLERIIKASSNAGDVVLDPFCGCATTCVAAERLGRQWVGIDISHKAYELVKERLSKEVEQSSDLFDPSKDVHYFTSPPTRTAQGSDRVTYKYVYVISNPRYPGEYKVGITSDMKRRLSHYQTSDPERGYQVDYSHHTPQFRAIEKAIHTDPALRVRGEWVKGELDLIIRKIKQLDTEALA